MEYLQYTQNFIIFSTFLKTIRVLNLVINGIPSIRWDTVRERKLNGSFKPCYKWNTFNTI